jgi:RHS repeat-associated protein
VADGVTQKFTGKERDGESGLDHFDARYFSAAQGRWTIPDWSARQEAVPYADIRVPQSLNLYAYVRNNPLAKADPDGHCGGPGEPTCAGVKVEETPPVQPAPIKTVTVTDKDGVAVTGIGPNAKVDGTVSVNGTPTDGIRLTESNENTENGKPSSTKKVEGATITEDGGKYTDTIGNLRQTDGSAAQNASVKKKYETTALTVVDKHTMSLTLPNNGPSCVAESTRTLSNVGPDGKATPYFTLTITQPVVTDAYKIFQ